MDDVAHVEVCIEGWLVRSLIAVCGEGILFDSPCGQFCVRDDMRSLFKIRTTVKKTVTYDVMISGEEFMNSSSSSQIGVVS